jgi:hypothetical protein
MAICLSNSSANGDYPVSNSVATGQCGNMYTYSSGGVIPFTAVTAGYPYYYTSTSGNSGGGGGGGYSPGVTIVPSGTAWTVPVSPVGPYDPIRPISVDADGNPFLPEGAWGGNNDTMEWVPKKLKINKKTLTSADIDKLIKQACLTVGKDETVVICVDPSTPNHQMQELARQFNEYADCRALVMAVPPIMVKTEGRPRDENERVDILARIGLIWETNPNMRLGELLATIMGEKKESLMDIDDYPLITALEIAYKKEKNDKPNQP